MNSQALSVENNELKTEHAPIIPMITASTIDAAKVRSADGYPSGGNLLLVVCVFALIFKVFFIDRKKNKERDEELNELTMRVRGMSEAMYSQRVDFERLQEKVKDNHAIATQQLEVHKICDHQLAQQQCNCKKHKKNK